MKIAIGSEHAGFALKQCLVKYLTGNGHQVVDLGYQSETKTDEDYTHVAGRIASRVAAGEYEQGILICGTGIGMTIVAGKFPGIRPALCTNTFSAKMAREHNDSNVLCLGTWNIGERLAYHIVDVYLASTFTGGRHIPRVKHIEEIEKNMMNQKD